MIDGIFGFVFGGLVLFQNLLVIWLLDTLGLRTFKDVLRVRDSVRIVKEMEERDVWSADKFIIK